MIALFTILVCFLVNSVSIEGFSNKRPADDYRHRVNGLSLFRIERGVSCSIHCVLCDKNGECRECGIGFYGPTCNLKCSSDCQSKGCKQTTGKCKYTPTTPNTSIRKQYTVGMLIGAALGALATPVLALSVNTM